MGAEKENARSDDRDQAKNRSESNDKTASNQRQGPRLPRPDAIKRAIDPADFYRREIERAPALKAQDDGWTQNFMCPFHEDKNGSFGVNLKSGAFRCFGCTAQGGSVLDFVMLRDRLDLDGARATLGERYGIKIGDAQTNPRAERPAPEPARLNPKQTPARVPIPADALKRQPKAHPTRGAPSRMWAYVDAAGRPLCFVCRFDPPDGRKVFMPLTWTPGGHWQWKAPPEPRPLYHLDRIAARPDAIVLVCEGEKAADAAAELFPEMVTTTTMNGAQSPAKSDLRPLAGRRVRVWPDADPAGANYAKQVAALALAVGAVSVEVLDLSFLGAS